MNVEVFTCFEVTPRRSADDKMLNIVNKENKAFRLCIKRDDKSNLLQNSDWWPEYVTLRAWYRCGERKSSNEQIECDEQDADRPSNAKKFRAMNELTAAAAENIEMC
jgi:hypothetical protein